MQVTRLYPDLCACVYTFTVLPDGSEQLVEYESVCDRHARIGMVALRHAAIVEESRRFNRVAAKLAEIDPSAELVSRMRDDGTLEVIPQINRGRKKKLRTALGSMKVEIV